MAMDAGGGARDAGAWKIVLGAAVVIAAAAAFAVDRLHALALFPVQAVRFEGDIVHVSDQALRSAVAPHLEGGLLFVDLAAIRGAVTALPWVSAASVWRVWPDGLRIRVDEHEPVARWGEGALLTAAGERFRPERRPAGLPALAGPDGSAATVLERFRTLGQRLGEIDAEPVAVELDERRAWRVTLEDGVALRFGRDHFDVRLQRLIDAWPAINRYAGERSIAAVDTRYPNGLAVQWVPPADEQDNGGDPNR
ncbi:MAG: cell division protein FtsQ/DivIB [Arhodomonas sp.]|nr:cell division protein FtsQ/DivIB [Arhodomonas sp.]